MLGRFIGRTQGFYAKLVSGDIQCRVDLAILAVLASYWMVRDAQVRGLSAWPFIVITLLAGSCGPLLCLVTREGLAVKRPQSVE